MYGNIMYCSSKYGEKRHAWLNINANIEDLFDLLPFCEASVYPWLLGTISTSDNRSWPKDILWEFRAVVLGYHGIVCGMV